MSRKVRVTFAALAAALLSACEPPPEFVSALSDPGEAKYEKWVLGQWYEPIDGSIMISSGVVLLTVADYQVLTAATTETSVSVDAVDRYNGTMLQVSLVFQNRDGGGASLQSYIGFPTEMDGEVYYNLVRGRTPGLIGFPSTGTTEIPHYYRVREPAPNVADYTAPGAEPGHLILRLFRPAPDMMLVCGLLPFSVGEHGMHDEAAALLAEAGMTVRSERVPIRINGVPVEPDNPDASTLHTLADGSRGALRRFVRDAPAKHFQQILTLTRVGSARPDPETDLEFRKRLRRYGDKCDIRTDD